VRTLGAETGRGGLSSMQQAIRGFLSTSGIGPRLRDAEVHRAWLEVVGPDLAARARPVRFRAGELTVAVRSAPHLQELKSFTGESFRRAANERLGGERIRRVTFRLEH